MYDRDAAFKTLKGDYFAEPIEETIALLLKIKWWDWSIEEIMRNIPVLVGDNVRALEALVEKRAR
ncbi:hypothetical protein SCACP_08980 [Sporomusa carbonis]|uniref:hypothetical protein n=1 Tax=Sporomusa carbonis TaxID=3076075 RepID=UPI003A752232